MYKHTSVPLKIFVFKINAMKRQFFITAVLLCLFTIETQAYQFHLTSNGEDFYVDVSGINNIQPDPIWGGYKYRRDQFDMNLVVNPHIAIVGGSCVPNGYVSGVFKMQVFPVTGFYYNTGNQSYFPLTGDTVDNIVFNQTSGTIDFTANYRSFNSLNIVINLTFADPSPTCTPGTLFYFQIFLHPEPTVAEMYMTSFANSINGGKLDDDRVWKDKQCNDCNNKMGLPGYAVNPVSLTPAFSDLDYTYASLGPDISFLRSLSMSGYNGMFGNWCFNYEQAIRFTNQVEVNYNDGTGNSELFYKAFSNADFMLLRGEKASRKSVKFYYPPNPRFEVFDPDRMVFYVLEPDTLNQKYVLKRIRDMYNNTVTLVYDGQSRLTALTDAAGRTTTFSYGSGALCTGLILPDGRQCTYQYNNSGLLTDITDIYGNQVGFTYDTLGYVKNMVVNNQIAYFDYNYAANYEQLTSITNLDGKTSFFTIEMVSPGTTTRHKITDASGKATRYHLDIKTSTLLAEEDIASGTKKEYTYDANSLLTQLKRGNNYIADYIYDTLKLVTQFKDFDNNTCYFQYDTLGNITQYTDARGFAWVRTYNPQGSLVSKQSPSGATETYTYSNTGLLISRTLPGNITYTYTYDNFGNISSITHPSGGTVYYGYDAFGFNCTSYTDAENNTTTYQYDDLDRWIKKTHPDGTWIAATYDCCAQTSVTDEKGNTVNMERTPLTLITKITDAMGYETNFHLDGAGKPTMVQTPDMAQWGYTYNNSGLLTEKTDPLGKSTTYSHDALGRVSSITDPNQNTTTFSYSYNSNLLSVTMGASVLMFGYDSLGRNTSFLNARGDGVIHTYNSDGKAIQRTMSGLTDTYAYNGAGFMTNYSNNNEAVTLQYTGINVGQISYSGNVTFDFEYNLNNAPTKVYYHQGLPAEQHYDNRGRVTSLKYGTDSITQQFDAASNLTHRIRSNGITTQYTYDNNNRIIAVKEYNSTDTLIKFIYVRNNMGNVITEERYYPYSDTGIVVATDTGGVYQSFNTLSQWQNQSLTYDADGNLTGITPGPFSATCDALNRPLTININGATINYQYNAESRLATKTLINGSVTTTNHYYYDYAGKLLQIKQVETGTVWRFIYAGTRLVACAINNEMYFYHFDQLGNTIALSNRQGSIVQSYVYDVWGKLLRNHGTVEQPFLFNGASGVTWEYGTLYRMNYRFYDALSGRFIQRDPAGHKGGVNLYVYAGNNPVNRKDPTGLFDDMTFEMSISNEETKNNQYAEANNPEREAAKTHQWVRAVDNFGDRCDKISNFIPGGGTVKALTDEKATWKDVFLEAGKDFGKVLETPFKVYEIYEKQNEIEESARRGKKLLEKGKISVEEAQRMGVEVIWN